MKAKVLFFGLLLSSVAQANSEYPASVAAYRGVYTGNDGAIECRVQVEVKGGALSVQLDRADGSSSFNDSLHFVNLVYRTMVSHYDSEFYLAGPTREGLDQDFISSLRMKFWTRALNYRAHEQRRPGTLNEVQIGHTITTGLRAETSHSVCSNLKKIK